MSIRVLRMGRPTTARAPLAIFDVSGSFDAGPSDIVGEGPNLLLVTGPGIVGDLRYGLSVLGQCYLTATAGAFYAELDVALTFSGAGTWYVQQLDGVANVGGTDYDLSIPYPDLGAWVAHMLGLPVLASGDETAASVLCTLYVTAGEAATLIAPVIRMVGTGFVEVAGELRIYTVG